MGWEREFSEILRDELEFSKQKNAKYSVRAFAKKMGLSPGALSQILNQKKKWNLSPERAAEILKRLGSVSRIRKNKLLLKLGQAPELQEKDLPEDSYSLLTDWTYAPILFSFDLPQPQSSPAAIARRLGIAESRVNEVIEDLIRGQFLARSSTGEITRQENFLKTTDGPPVEIIRKNHAMNLDLAKRALEKIPVEKRDYTSMTFTGGEKEIGIIRQEIRKLYEKINVLMDEGEQNTGVYRLSVQFYPMEFE